MKSLVCTLAAVGLVTLSPRNVSAADLDDGYYDAPVAVEEQPPVVVRERIIERNYYIAPPSEWGPGEYYWRSPEW